MSGVSSSSIGVWFPTIRANTGTDVFTKRLVKCLNQRGIKAEMTWLPLRAEYAPWTVSIPKPPKWATVVHVNTWLHSRFLPKDLPVVATIHHAVHHPDAHTYKGWLRASYHKYWIAPNERRVMLRANKVVAVSQFVAESAKKALSDIPMQVIYNGIDTDIYRPDPSIKKPHKPFRLLFVGSWMARKGVDLLAPIMRELGDDFELYYTGGPAAEKDKASMPNNMHDIGRLNGDAEVILSLQNADALLFPSRSEGHPLVAIEAMACGLTIVSMYGSPITEVISDRESGLLCSRDNVLNLVAAVRWLQDNAIRIEMLAKAARREVTNRFSAQVMVDSYTHVYQMLIREGNKL